MERTTTADFRGVPYVAVDEGVTRVVIMRGHEQFNFDLPAPKEKETPPSTEQ